MLPYAAQAYTRVASSLHWLVAIPLVGCVGTVLKAQVKKRSNVITVLRFDHKYPTQ
jgi:hypothetical protein